MGKLGQSAGRMVGFINKPVSYLASNLLGTRSDLPGGYFGGVRGGFVFGNGGGGPGVVRLRMPPKRVDMAIHVG